MLNYIIFNAFMREEFERVEDQYVFLNAEVSVELLRPLVVSYCLLSVKMYHYMEDFLPDP